MLVNILGNPRKYQIVLDASKKEPTTRCKPTVSRLMMKALNLCFNTVEYYANEGLEEVYPHCAV